MISARQELGVEPVVDGQLTRGVPLVAERYLFSGRDQKILGNYGTVMIVHFGGAKVEEMEPSDARTVSFPSKVLLLAPRGATRWQYCGTADFGIFYFPDHATGIVEEVKDVARAAGTTLSFTDALVSAAALELLREFERGANWNEDFAIRLAQVMLEQTLRVIRAPLASLPPAPNLHLSRLEAIFKYIQQNFDSDLSIETLAKRVGVSATHFRRLFRHATGTSPHDYIIATRLAHARELLTMTSVPISRVALESGFSNQSHLTRVFREAHGTTPAAFRYHARPVSRRS